MFSKNSFEILKTIQNLQDTKAKCHNHVTEEEAGENIVANRS